MSPKIESSEWDFLSLVAGWNLYGLPGLLLLILSGWLIGRHFHRREGRRPGLSDEGQLESSRSSPFAIRTIALVHLCLAIRAGIGLVQELLTLRVQGIPQSFIVTGIIIPSIAIPANMAIGHGLWRLRPWGRILAIGWNTVVANVTASVAFWQWKHRALVRLDQWPDYLVADGLPWILLAILLLPKTRSVFAMSRNAAVSSKLNKGRTRWGEQSPLSPLALLLLCVVVSTLLVDIVDWVARSVGDDHGLG
jgi:hypothetical protein